MTWHRMQYRVIFSDTDAGGIVYHAHFFEMAERGRNEAMRSVGIAAGGFRQVGECGLVLREARIKFVSPALVDDLLTICTRVTYVSLAKSTWETRIMRGQTVICNVVVDLACVDSKTKSARFTPEQIVEGLRALATPARSKAV